MQDIVMKAAKSEEYHNKLLFVTNFYEVDLDKVHLEMQLSMVGPFCIELPTPLLKMFLKSLDVYHQLSSHISLKWLMFCDLFSLRLQLMQLVNALLQLYV